MKIANLVKLELFKIIKRKESALLLGMFLIPMLYGFGFKSGSSNFEYKGTGLVSCLDWLNIMTSMISQISIFYIFMAIITVKSLSSEIEDSSIHLYIHRVNNRRKIYISKFIALFIYLSFSYIVFLLFAIACYYILMKDVENVSSNTFFATEYSAECIMSVVEIYFSFIFMIALSLFLSTMFKPLVCVAITLLEHIASLFICQLSYICYVSPWFYNNKITDSMYPSEKSVGNERLPFFSNNTFFIFASCMIIYLIYIFVLYYIGQKKFEREDL